MDTKESCSSPQVTQAQLAEPELGSHSDSMELESKLSHGSSLPPSFESV